MEKHGGWRRCAAAAALLLTAALAAGCELAFTSLKAEASDEWTRSYPLTPAGRVEVENTNGAIEVGASPDGQVHVRAQRIVHAASDEAAKERLRRIEIRDTASPDEVRIETNTPHGGSFFSGSAEVRYWLQVPRTARVKVTCTNGRVTVNGITGRVEAETTNGQVSGSALGGPVRAATTNGSVAIELAAVDAEGVTLETTNGGVRLTIPSNAKADLRANTVNGSIDTSGVALDQAGENSRRRVEGRVNGGGPRIRLETTNGSIQVNTRS